MMKYIFILGISFLTLSSCAQEYKNFEELKTKIVSKTIPLITVDKLKSKQDAKSSILIIDAREINEYNASHIKDAKFVGYNDFTIKSLKKVDKETTIVVYCSVGYRSERVGEKLKKAGFKKVMNLKGGIFDWVNKGYLVYDNDEVETKKVHAYDKSWGKWLTKGEKVYE